MRSIIYQILAFLIGMYAQKIIARTRLRRELRMLFNDKKESD